jgi:methylglyoxal synthase
LPSSLMTGKKKIEFILCATTCDVHQVPLATNKATAGGIVEWLKEQNQCHGNKTR